MISIIVARAHNNVIGQSNDLPWYLPADLKHFKQITTGHSVVMGRKTMESILSRLGKPLPDRHNIVVTRNEDFQVEGVDSAHSLQDAINRGNKNEIFVIGGAEIYAQALSFTDKLYITEVEADIKGDTYFPEIDPKVWKLISKEAHEKDDKNKYNYSFNIYERAQ